MTGHDRPEYPPGTDKIQPGKHDWCVFLSTDAQLDPQQMLELYAMRWAIKPLLGDNARLVMQTIDLHVQRFFVQALQLGPERAALLRAGKITPEQLYGSNGQFLTLEQLHRKI